MGSLSGNYRILIAARSIDVLRDGYILPIAIPLNAIDVIEVPCELFISRSIPKMPRSVAGRSGKMAIPGPEVANLHH